MMYIFTWKELLLFAAVALLLIAVICILGVSLYASFQCSWHDNILYGKRILWAWYFGYCEA